MTNEKGDLCIYVKFDAVQQAEIHEATMDAVRADVWPKIDKANAEAKKLQTEIVGLRSELDASKDREYATAERCSEQANSVDKARSQGFAVGLIFGIAWFAVIGLIAWIAL